MDLSYILNALGEERDRYFNAVAPPIIRRAISPTNRWMKCAGPLTVNLMHTSTAGA